MLNKMRPIALVIAGLLASGPAWSVDLVGVHDLALQNDPRLRAAGYRRDAIGENKTQAWSNLLPNLSADAGLARGGNETDIAGTKVSDNDTDNETWAVTLRQSL